MNFDVQTESRSELFEIKIRLRVCIYIHMHTEEEKQIRGILMFRLDPNFYERK